MAGLFLTWKLALRGLRGGLGSLRILFLCLLLGVTAIAGVESLSAALLSGLAEQGQILLGGDVAVRLVHRPATPRERAFFAGFGKVSESATLRAMAYRVRNGRPRERQLIELKAVDARYPLFGDLAVAPSRPSVRRQLLCGASICGAFVEQTLVDRLGPGSGLRIGTQEFRISGIITSEPDRISGGFSLGPHTIVSLGALERTGLVQPGSLIDFSYRIALRPGISPQHFKAFATAAFPHSGWEVRTREEAAPGIRSFIEQVTLFLTLVGLTALAIGGVGGSQAARGYVAASRDEIAILRALGAEGPLLFAIFLGRIMSVAIAATALGMILGASVPFLAGGVVRAILPAGASIVLYPQALLLAGAFGLFAALAFSILPLARIHEIRPAQLFRDLVEPSKTRPPFRYLAASVAAGAAVLYLAIAIAPSPRSAIEFLAGLLAIFLALASLARGLRTGLGRLPRASHPLLRIAIANLVRPGTQSGNVVAALGLGLTLLTTVTFLERSISAQVNETLPKTAPSFFFIDIQPDEAAAFDRTIGAFRDASGYQRTPMIRGRIVSLKGIAAANAVVSEQSKWALAGDRGISYSRTLPPGTKVIEGQWWPANYSGQTLISFDAELARGMGLTVGDRMTLNVLGREIEGRIANLREVNFRSGRQNFILVLSPGLIDKAPHTYLATVRIPPARENALYREVTDRFPNVSAVRVRDAIAQVNSLIGALALGVRIASLVTIAAGVLVLAGAIATGAQTRLYDATVLKIAGATRPWIAATYAIEYGFLGIVTGALALVTGAIAAALVARELLDVDIVLDPGVAVLTVVSGTILTCLFGLSGSWRALSSKPARQLRAP